MFCHGFLYNARGRIVFLSQFLFCFGLPRFRLQIEMCELPASNETRHSEDEMHALELRLCFRNGLKVEPPQNGRACSLLILSRLLDAQCEGMLHDFDERSLARLCHILGHVLDDSVFGQSGLEVHVGQHGQHDYWHEIV